MLWRCTRRLVQLDTFERGNSANHRASAKRTYGAIIAACLCYTSNRLDEYGGNSSKCTVKGNIGCFGKAVECRILQEPWELWISVSTCNHTVGGIVTYYVTTSINWYRDFGHFDTVLIWYSRWFSFRVGLVLHSQP